MSTTRDILYFKIVSNFTRLTAREITYNNLEISLVVFMPNITTNHGITYTYFFKFSRRRRNNGMFIIVPSRQFSLCYYSTPPTPIFVILVFHPHTRALLHYSNLQIFLIPITVFFFNPRVSLSISFITVN